MTKHDSSVRSVSGSLDDYEIVSRRLRWLAVVLTLIFIPPDSPSAPFAYGLAAMTVVLNIWRYLRPLAQGRLASPVIMLIMDNLVIAGLLVLVNNVNSPFLLFTIFGINAAAYCYGIRGAIAAAGFYAAILAALPAIAPFQPIVLGHLPALLLAAGLLVGFGMYAERLTRIERNQKDIFAELSRELRFGHEHLATLIDSLDDAIFVVDNHGRIKDFNSAARALSQPKVQLLGASLSKALQLRPRVMPDSKPIDLFKAGSVQRRRDLSMVMPDGMIDFDITVRPVCIDGCDTSDCIIVCKDITKERAVDDQRSTFISVASHELRTPVAIMEAALSGALLSKDKLDVQTIAILAQAHRHSQFLANLVKDLAMLSEANNDTIPLEFNNVQVSNLFAELNQDFEAQVRQKGLQLHFTIASDTPDIMTTEYHVREILQNYLTNAIKYTESGSIIVSAEPAAKNGVVFSVADHGIGISAVNQKHLFTKFFRAEDYETRKYSGTGLGLYLCRELAHRLGGRVWCKSDVGRGSTFYLEVPNFNSLKVDKLASTNPPKSTIQTTVRSAS